MTPNHSNHDQWDACPDGMLGGLANRLQANRRAKSTQRAVGVASVLVLIAGWLAFQVASDDEQLTHADVRRHAEEFIAGTLDQETTERIQQHIDACPECRRMIAEMRSRLQQPGSTRVETGRLKTVHIDGRSTPNVLYAVNFSTR